MVRCVKCKVVNAAAAGCSFTCCTGTLLGPVMWDVLDVADLCVV